VNPDTYPDAFSFAPNTAPYGTTSVMSGPVTISGINARTSVQLTSTTTNSGYSVGCTGVFVSEPGTLLPNDTLCVRQTASSQPGGTAQTTINVGGRAATYVTTSSSQSADVVPDAFSFVDESGVAPGSTVTSNTITITGLTGAAAVGIDLGAYSIGCVATGFTSRNGSISNGQTICVQHTASSGHNATVTTTLAIGGVTATFASTTVPPDTSPDPFAFQPQSDVPMGSSVISNPATITGIDSPAPISVTGGEYAIGCGGNWTSQPATVSADQQVCIRHIAASQPGTTTTTTLTVGNASASLVSTTVAPSSGGGGGGALSVYDVLGLLALLLSTKYQRLRPKLNAIVCRFGARAPIRNS